MYPTQELLLQLNAKLDTLIALVKGGAVASVDISTTVKDEGDSQFVVSYLCVHCMS